MTVPPSETQWAVLTQELDHLIRVFYQQRRDQGKKRGPKPGEWELPLLVQVLRAMADHTGLEFRG